MGAELPEPGCYVDTQRKWQTENTHRASRARHHDSLSIRDKYVRCH